MKLKKLSLLLPAATLLLTASNTYAWNHEISVGYGWGNEVEKDYKNNAYVLSGKFYKFPKIDNTLIATIDGTIAKLHADTPENQNVTTASVGLGLRAYFLNPDSHQTRPYLGISSGPAYLSSAKFGEQDQGGHWALQSTLEGGIEFGLKNQRSIDLNLHLVHYCNAGLANPNRGFNVPFVLSVGYQF
jgi:hypothetical protein